MLIITQQLSLDLLFSNEKNLSSSNMNHELSDKKNMIRKLVDQSKFGFFDKNKT